MFTQALIKYQTEEFEGRLMPLRISIMARHKGLQAQLTPISQGIRVGQRSTWVVLMSIRKVSSIRKKSLQCSAYGRRLDCNTQIVDLASRAYVLKFPARHVIFHLQDFMVSFLCL